MKRNTPREALELTAFQLFEKNPKWGYRKVGGELKSEFGYALRGSALAKIRKETPSYKARQEQRQNEEYIAAQAFMVQPSLTPGQFKRELIRGGVQPVTGIGTIKKYKMMTRANETTIAQLRRHERVTLRPISSKQDMPIVDAATYRQRAMTLRGEGFQDFEWQWLAFHDISTPNMVRMRRDRAADVSRWRDDGLDRYEIEDKIVSKYLRNDWVFKTDGRFNPFAMFDTETRGWGTPSDRTPQIKKPAARSDFMAAKGKTDSYNKWRFGVEDTRGFNK